MPEINIDNEQEFNQFVKDNNLDILNWKAIAKMLFEQRKINEKHASQIEEIARNTHDYSYRTSVQNEY